MNVSESSEEKVELGLPEITEGKRAHSDYLWGISRCERKDRTKGNRIIKMFPPIRAKESLKLEGHGRTDRRMNAGGSKQLSH
jgi:hypothetical protein